eukprot:TRINITY_DN9182_c0_g1_i1.p1 TRINITY_DN9182_c0_g1~~TRINITY_DN9182_c0_g1_i1.p1  ORF type:complete len:217 (+),score=25.75 TRINITY_DN9182_c0_g1_i1:143-793(+)
MKTSIIICVFLLQAAIIFAKADDDDKNKYTSLQTSFLCETTFIGGALSPESGGTTPFQITCPKGCFIHIESAIMEAWNNANCPALADTNGISYCVAADITASVMPDQTLSVSQTCEGQNSCLINNAVTRGFQTPNIPCYHQMRLKWRCRTPSQLKTACKDLGGTVKKVQSCDSTKQVNCYDFCKKKNLKVVDLFPSSFPLCEGSGTKGIQCCCEDV